MAKSTESRRQKFDNSKAQCLGKRDKSFAGRIDVKAVEICSVLNERPEYYTTSSCAGRSFLYRGHGIKSSTFMEGQEPNVFERCRISHDLVGDAKRYFDVTTLDSDPSGGADPLRTVGQYDYAQEEEGVKALQVDAKDTCTSSNDQVIWLRFEPFILHVCCRSLASASTLMAVARPAFKNVGLTTWKEGKYLIAIWGDEGLDMPLCNPEGLALFEGNEEWLKGLVNERHDRNWSKIVRFAQAVRAMPLEAVDEDEVDVIDSDDGIQGVPKSFDVIGDVAILYTTPEGGELEQAQIGEAIMKKNKAIKVVAVRSTTLSGTARAPAGELDIIAGAQRRPIISTHTEYGIKCVVDLDHTFFSPRMGQERLRICQQVARGENVLVLFAGVGMEAFQIAGRTEASSILTVELNAAAVKCARAGHRMLERNKTVKCAGAADRLEIREGDVLAILPTLPRSHFDRVLAPRPKEGAMDGDLGSGDAGSIFLEALLPVLREDGGECHWYDFVADHEFPHCERTKKTIQGACEKQGLTMEVIHVANAGSVAKRQLRVCVDFRLCGKQKDF